MIPYFTVPVPVKVRALFRKLRMWISESSKSSHKIILEQKFFRFVFQICIGSVDFLSYAAHLYPARFMNKLVKVGVTFGFFEILSTFGL